MLLDRVGERTCEPSQYTGKTGGAAGTCLDPAGTQFRHRGQGRGIVDGKATALTGTESGNAVSDSVPHCSTAVAVSWFALTVFGSPAPAT